jgi:hypothetical protein
VKQLIDKARRWPIFAQADQLLTETGAISSSSCPHLGRIVTVRLIYSGPERPPEKSSITRRLADEIKHSPDIDLNRAVVPAIAVAVAGCGNGTLLAFVEP